MRRFSHILNFLAVALVLFVAGSVAKADGVDPSIGLGPTGSSLHTTQTACAVEAETSCVVTLDSTGSAIADIFNNTGFDIITETVTVTATFLGTTPTAFAPPLVCDPTNPFNYTVTAQTANSCTYSEIPVEIGSILGGETYGVHLKGFCVDGPCVTPLTSLQFTLDWVNGTTPTPEPGAMLLLGTGLVGLVAGKKRLMGAKRLV